MARSLRISVKSKTCSSQKVQITAWVYAVSKHSLAERSTRREIDVTEKENGEGGLQIEPRER